MTQTVDQSIASARPVLLGRVEAIFIAERGAGPMRPVEQAEARIGAGLAGDRYAGRCGTFSKTAPEAEPIPPGAQVTLIEAEAVEAVRRDGNLPLDPAETRRNILTRGVALNHFVGREFNVGGQVILRGVKLCEPCGHLEKLTRQGVREALIHRGGLRAEVVRGGLLHVGDQITLGR
ncbi:MAG: MOSC domain-containing protein [Phycisphaerales bacterium]|nr:MOSC domain-containing protein [Phycisphaerales bacterium]